MKTHKCICASQKVDTVIMSLSDLFSQDTPNQLHFFPIYSLKEFNPQVGRGQLWSPTGSLKVSKRHKHVHVPNYINVF